MSTRITFALILAAAVVSTGTADALVTPEILANPDRFDGHMVTIEGTMTNLRQRVSRGGDPYYKFDLRKGLVAFRRCSRGPHLLFVLHALGTTVSQPPWHCWT